MSTATATKKAPAKKAPARKSVYREGISEPGEASIFKNPRKKQIKFDPDTGRPTSGTTDSVPDGVQMCDAVKAMGIEVPRGFELRLVEAIYSDSTTAHSWTRSEQGEDATTQENNTRRVQYKFKIVPAANATGALPELDMKELLKFLLTHKSRVNQPKGRKKKRKRAGILGTGDRQLQKVDWLGGTKELLEREVFLQSEFIRKMKNVDLPFDEFVFMDAGDSFEGFQNLVKQKINNDLGTESAKRAVLAIVLSWGMLLANYTKELIFAIPPSNHCQPGRQAGEAYEQPGEDMAVGIYLTAVIMLKLMGINARLETAEYHRSTAYFEVVGHKMSLGHGHIGSADRARMIEKLAGDGLEMAECEVVWEGHRHSFAVQKVGRTVTKLQRWHIVLDALENGSTYYSEANGRTSLPSMAMWLVEEDVPFHPANGIGFTFPPELLKPKANASWTSSLENITKLYDTKGLMAQLR